uniref:Uncharacterized protein n=1 Tax=Acrobeloides nanus TaxID=290746 RepID=A0A914CJK7_9BILA
MMRPSIFIIFFILANVYIQTVISEPQQSIFLEIKEGSRLYHIYESIRNEQEKESYESPSKNKNEEDDENLEHSEEKLKNSEVNLENLETPVISQTYESESESESNEVKKAPKYINRRPRSTTRFCERVCERTLSCISQGKRRCPGYRRCGCNNLKNLPQHPLHTRGISMEDE